MYKKTPEEISFGEWLRQRRRMLDLTQQELADQVGCARITLRRIESRALKPSKELAQILLEKLGIPEIERPRWVHYARGLADFPSRSVDSSPSKPLTNLPASLTSFIGREKEQAEVLKRIHKHRLVTLVGSGGVGKTRLSLKIGEQVLAEHADGVWLVELAPILDPLLVPLTTAMAIGLHVEPQRPVIELLSADLHNKKMLIILDNCEHVLDACAQLADTLSKRCSQLRFLATSREPLEVLGEAIYRVPSLGLPHIEQLLEKCREYESVCLFEERAQLMQMDFSLTMENASHVAKICNHLDGIPLAIELAAARIDTFSIEQIATSLQKNMNLLTSGNRTALPRHQTLRAVIDWSYDLLSPVERTLFHRLSVFVNGWTLEAAESICSDARIKPEAVFDLLASLVKKSLVNIEEPHGITKYRMLETIRQYATEKLAEAGDSMAMHHRHLNYFLELGESLTFPSGEERVWLNQVESERENFRAALTWSLEPGGAETNESINVEKGLRLAIALAPLWEGLGYLREGMDWLARLFMVTHSAPSDHRARGFYLAGFIARELGEFEHARGFAIQSLMLGYELERSTVIASALKLLGIIALSQGQHGEAFTRLEEGVKIFRELREERGLAKTLIWLAEVHLLQGDLERAIVGFEESKVLFHRIGEPGGVAQSLAGLGEVARLEGNLAQATSLLKESLSLTQVKVDIPYQLVTMARIALAQQLHKRVARLCGAAEAGRETYHIPLLPIDQSNFNSLVNAARAELGEAAFVAAWEEGKKMTLDEAVAYAMDEKPIVIHHARHGRA